MEVLIQQKSEIFSVGANVLVQDIGIQVPSLFDRCCAVTVGRKNLAIGLPI